VATNDENVLTWFTETDEDFDGAPPFSSGRDEAAVIANVRPSIYRVQAACPTCGDGGRGTGTCVLANASKREAIIVTAAHVVCSDSGHQLQNVQVRAEGTTEFLPVSAVHKLPQPGLDLAMLFVRDVQYEPQQMGINHNPEHEVTVLERGLRLFYAGYPQPTEQPLGLELIVASGMIAGYTQVSVPPDWSFTKYVIDGMVTAGMSGGPLFCPVKGRLAGVIVEVVLPGHVTGHGWGYAIPSSYMVPLMHQMLLELGIGDIRFARRTDDDDGFVGE